MQSLAGEGLGGEAQLALAAAMGRLDAERPLRRIAASSLPARHRLAAAERLVTIGGAPAAAAAYRAIAGDKRVSGHQRQEAQREADRLREL